MVVLDKMDYCASLKNLKAVSHLPNFKASEIASNPRPALSADSLPYDYHLRIIVTAAQFIKGDIQSADLLSFLLASEEIDTVMHFAAQVRCERQRSANTQAFAHTTPARPLNRLTWTTPSEIH